MWYGQMPPWMQRQSMTSGGGNAPISMQLRQMRPGGSLSSPPPAVQRGSSSMNPAQMGMLARLLAQQPGNPATEAPGRAAGDILRALNPAAQAPGGAAATGGFGGTQTGDALQLSLLERLHPGFFGAGLVPGGLISSY